MKIYNFLKDILSPKKCYSCNIEWTFLCQKCLDEIWYFESICPICKEKNRDFKVHFYCKNELIYYDKIIILTHYKNKIIKKLIKNSKFHHKKDILQDLSFYLWEKLKQNIKEEIKDLILIPTPMYFWKKISRWYNQSEILTKNISKKFNINYNFKLIKKIKSTKQQSHLSKMERIENLLWSFQIDKNILKQYQNKTIIIVDDVVSTWTTINEIAKILKNNKIKKVYWLCVASD